MYTNKTKRNIDTVHPNISVKVSTQREQADRHTTHTAPQKHTHTSTRTHITHTHLDPENERKVLVIIRQSIKRDKKK